MKQLRWVILFFIVTGFAHAANDRTFAWQVTSGTANVYLLGSIHFADSSFYPLRKEIEDAFNAADTLVVELDINSIGAADYNSLLLQKGVYSDGTTIRDVISEQTWLELQQHLKQLNINYDALKSYRPGMLVLTLSSLQATHMGLDPQLGIDIHFMQQAKQQAKSVVALETLEQQFDLFLDVPDGDLLLKESLYMLDESGHMMTDLAFYWKQGDEGQMSRLLFEDAVKDYPAFSKIYDRLIYDRNRQMAVKIDAMLKQKAPGKASYFIVVGTGHLIGEQGIVNLLREKGYDVRRF